MGSFAVGMDLGGTNARAAVVDRKGLIVAVEKKPLEGRSPEAAADALAICVRGALSRAGGSEAEISGFGVGVAGQIEAKSRRVLMAPNFGWKDLEFAPLLETRLKRPVHLLNDLSAAAFGESRAGAARGHADAVLVSVGSGVGSGLVLGGRLYEGARGVAGEFGHIKVKPGGRLCGCSERGCLEAYTGGRPLGARASEAMKAGRATILEVPEGLNPTADMLERAAEKGDPLSLELLGEAAALLGTACANLVTLLNPSVLMLGGGVLIGSRRVRDGIEQAVREQASRTALEGLIIVDAVLGDDAGVVGAAMFASEAAQVSSGP